jgi:hypothetical protein
LGKDPYKKILVFLLQNDYDIDTLDFAIEIQGFLLTTESSNKTQRGQANGTEWRQIQSGGSG